MTDNVETGQQPEQRPRSVPSFGRWKTWIWAATGAYFLLLSYLLLTPHPLWFLGSAGRSTEEAVDSTLADYAQHTLAYAVLGVLITFATAGEPHRRRYAWLAAAAVHGMLCECIQHFIPHREFGLHDAIANAVGVIAGWGIAAIVCRSLNIRRTMSGATADLSSNASATTCPENQAPT